MSLTVTENPSNESSHKEVADTSEESEKLFALEQHKETVKKDIGFIEDWVVNNTFSRLYFRRKFGVHRIVGLFFLIQYAWCIYLYFSDYNAFSKSPLIWSVPLTGVIQSIVAVYTFTFLPKKAVDGGYFGDKGVLSYNFIKENVFYEILLLFPWLYYSDRFYPIFKSTFVLEYMWVFFPYYIRTYFPKTRIRDSLTNNDRNKSDLNRKFFIIVTYITKIFYIWAKHFIGLFLNYGRYLNRFGPNEQYHLYLLLIFGSSATTIAVFMHTLKFKGYMGPKKAFLGYMISYMATFYSYYNIAYVFILHWDIFVVVMLGLLINFLDRKYQYAYQGLVLSLFTSMRYGYIQPESIDPMILYNKIFQ